MTECLKCERLMELYGRTPKSPRDYWLMTELFFMLHGGDVCPAAYGEVNDCENSKSEKIADD